MRKFAHENEAVAKIFEAIKSGDEAQAKEAWDAFRNSIAEELKNEYMEAIASNDDAVLAQRGYRTLTAQEKKWYNKVIDAMKSNEPKQAFTAILGGENEEDLMPTTIIENVAKELQEEHPLLKKINFQYVGYLTKWVLNDHSTQKAQWGTITAEIAKEITSAFKVIDINQNKLSAFAVIEHGMLDLGPVFLDKYIRAALHEAMACGLEAGIISGTGKDEPIGLIRDIHEGVSVSSTTGYPLKTAIPVKSFAPAEYGALVARLAKTEKGKARKFAKVNLICSMNDYLTKIMPATTILNTSGAYVNNLFPFATDVIVSNEVEDGKAVMFLDKEYFAAVGGSKNNVIEYSDEYKFFEDQRAFKVKLYGTGRATDDTCALYLDISGLEPAYITVKNEVVTA